MESEIQLKTPPVQPLSQTPAPVLSPKNRLKIPLFILMGLMIITGSVFVGIQIGKNQMPNQQPAAIQPAATPTQIAVNPITLSITPTPAINPVTKWKIYTNNKYGFSIEYPDPVIVDEKTQNGMLSVFFRLKELDNSELVCNGTNLTININTDGWCGSLAFMGRTSKINESKYFLGQVSTTRYDDYFQDKHVETRLGTVSQGNNYYLLDYFIAPDDYSKLNENHKLFNQMLSTFRFIK